MDLKKAIPSIKFPSITEYNIKDLNEPLVSLSKAGFMCSPEYYNQGVAGALNDCYVRSSVLGKLMIAESNLPKGLKFKVYDAYRPICVQQRLWNYYRQKIKNENPLMSDEEIDKMTAFYISKPSYDENHPSLHNTGGAIDLTLVTDNGYALNMGTLFDDFTNRAWTNHFESYADCEEVKTNRRILYNAMIEAGFTNLPSEWWHYDYGTKFWGYFKEKDALYKGIIIHDLDGEFPLT